MNNACQMKIDQYPSLNKCNSALYQSFYRFLRIGATLPVSVATSVCPRLNAYGETTTNGHPHSGRQDGGTMARNVQRGGVGPLGTAAGSRTRSGMGGPVLVREPGPVSTSYPCRDTSPVATTYPESD
ncbi:Hypothetical protein CINCED_3A020497 [Cinara cedri]|uniref:Uncharacterized protein n=1 Tax=Cinara cedri TaxID=506608 RepID=A0A5E4MYY5_9HEMI|nr:Hypothetical protein CINCED_3A020497 [Cinara cedri]